MKETGAAPQLLVNRVVTATRWLKAMLVKLMVPPWVSSVMLALRLTVWGNPLVCTVKDFPPAPKATVSVVGPLTWMVCPPETAATASCRVV